MGVIRLLLALSVLASHCDAFIFLKLVGPQAAVQAFFVISGFYMAMVISNYRSWGDFYLSRYIRLIPAYLIVALLTLFLVFGWSEYLNLMGRLPLSAQIYFLLTNATIFFQDTVMFLQVEGGELKYAYDFSQSDPQLWKLLLIPQGWSLGLELIFYLLCPFLLKRGTGFLLAIVLASLGLKLALIHTCCGFDPWTYRFFPAEISTFLIGSLAYRFYQRVSSHKLITGHSHMFLLVLLIFTFSFLFIPMEAQLRVHLYVLLMAVCVGPVFHLTKSLKWDRFIGNLSYPVYISQFLILDYFLNFFGLPLPDGGFVTTVLLFAVTIVFSMALYIFCEKPVEAFRKRFKG